MIIIIIKVSNSTCKGNSTQAERFSIMNRMAPISAWWSSATGYKGLQIIRSRFFLSQLYSALSGPAAEQLQIGCRDWTHSAGTAIVSEAPGLQLLCLVTEPYPALHHLWKDTKRADRQLARASWSLALSQSSRRCFTAHFCDLPGEDSESVQAVDFAVL